MKVDEEKKKEDEDKNNQQPSTSAGNPNADSEDPEDDKTKKICNQLAETLAEKSKTLHLTAKNVKSIIHYWHKNPNTINVMMGLGPNSDIPNVRMTRSQTKSTGTQSDAEKNTNMALVIKSLYQERPKSFLDLDFDDNDEFDEDYAVSAEKNGEKGGEDDDVDDEEEEDDDIDEEGAIDEEISDELKGLEELDALDPFEQMDLEEMRKKEKEDKNMVQSMSHIMNLNDSSIRPDSCTIPHIGNSYGRDVFMTVTNPEYHEFVSAAINKSDLTIALDDLDDPEDADYDVQVDDEAMELDVEDWDDEFRRDRTTEIPRDEVERLLMDTLLAEKAIPACAIPQEAYRPNVEIIEEVGGSKKTQKERDAEASQRLASLAKPSASCSLLGDDPKKVVFSESEMNLLRTQMEQHVQLLTQVAVTCHLDNDVIHLKNKAQEMINDLNDRYLKAPNSIFDIPNLAPSIETCHDIFNMKRVEPGFHRWAASTDGFRGYAIRPEAVAVLARSRALKFPHLLPKVQPKIETEKVPFTRSEDLMLAVALLQYAHLPRRATRKEPDRYTAIHENCLPSRSVDAIRNHMKTMRIGTTPLHQIISQAEQGICSFELPPLPTLAMEGTIEQWPIEYQPNWFKMFIRVFQVVGKNEVLPIMSPKVSSRSGKDAENAVVTRSKSNEEDSDDDAIVEGDYCRLGKIGGSDQNIVMKKEDLMELVRKLARAENSHAQRRKNATPTKIAATSEDRGDESEKKNGSFSAVLETLRSASSPPTSKNSSNVGEKKNEEELFENTVESGEPPGPEKEKTGEEVPSNTPAPVEHKEVDHEVIKPSPRPDSAKKSRSQSPDNESHAQSPNSRDVMWDGGGPIEYCVEESGEYAYSPTSQASKSAPGSRSMSPIEQEEVIPGSPGSSHDSDYNRQQERFGDEFFDEENSSASGSKSPRDFDDNDMVANDPDYEDSMNGFIPLTPGRRPASASSFFGINIGNSNDYVETGGTRSLSRMSIPRTPGRSLEGSCSSWARETAWGVTDFAEMHAESMVGKGEEREGGLETIIEEEQTDSGLKSSKKRPPPVEVFSSVDDTDAATSEDDERPLKRNKTRSRTEIEKNGLTGMEDPEYRSIQQKTVMRKILKDVSSRLFMHQEKWNQIVALLSDENVDDEEKVRQLYVLLEKTPDILHLLLAFAPIDNLPIEAKRDHGRFAMRSAIDTIMDIDGYFSSTKVKTSRYIFNRIAGIGRDDGEQEEELLSLSEQKKRWEEMDSIEAAEKMFKILGQHRPLWEKVQRLFYPLAHQDGCQPEDFEYIDLTKPALHGNPQYEVIDSVSELLKQPGEKKDKKKGPLAVRSGQLFARTRTGFVPVEVTTVKWNRVWDLKLFNVYNQALAEDPNFVVDKIAEKAKGFPFGDESIVDRMKWLLDELKKNEAEKL